MCNTVCGPDDAEPSHGREVSKDEGQKRQKDSCATEYEEKREDAPEPTEEGTFNHVPYYWHGKYQIHNGTSSKEQEDRRWIRQGIPDYIGGVECGAPEYRCHHT